MKTCCTCKIELDDSLFHKNRSSKDGLQAQCKICNIERMKSYYKDKADKPEWLLREKTRAAKIQALVDAIKTRYGCAQCGENDSACLDFHHMRDKTDEVSYLVAVKSAHKIANEINKCIVVCANCHRKLHRYNLDVSHLPLCDIDVAEFDSCKSSRKSHPKLLAKTAATKAKVAKAKADRVDGRINANRLRHHPTKVDWPDKETLLQMVWNRPSAIIAKELGVSDKSICKRCKRYGIQKPPRGYWQKQKVS